MGIAALYDGFLFFPISDCFPLIALYWVCNSWSFGVTSSLDFHFMGILVRLA
jgi:hypothetical protein